MVDPALADAASASVEMGELTHCLNCDAPLHGSFCAACGQRAVPPNPTVAELAGDAWQELSGYDGRIMATVRGLARPGLLTRHYLDGRRARYLPPLRVYLIVSVVYFLVAAAAPNLELRRSIAETSDGVRVSVSSGLNIPTLSEEDRAEIRKQAADSPWIVRALLVAVADDPEGFRARFFTIMPRVFFGLLPVFAAIVSLFYRRRRFPTALVFAVHVHAFAFVVFAISEASKFAQSGIFSGIVGVIAMAVFVVYALRAFRAVFGGRWPATILKAVAIGFVYSLASIPAFFIILLWASWR